MYYTLLYNNIILVDCTILYSTTPCNLSQGLYCTILYRTIVYIWLAVLYCTTRRHYITVAPIITALQAVAVPVHCTLHTECECELYYTLHTAHCNAHCKLHTECECEMYCTLHNELHTANCTLNVNVSVN